MRTEYVIARLLPDKSYAIEEDGITSKWLALEMVKELIRERPREKWVAWQDEIRTKKIWESKDTK